MKKRKFKVTSCRLGSVTIMTEDEIKTEWAIYSGYMDLKDWEEPGFFDKVMIEEI